MKTLLSLICLVGIATAAEPIFVAFAKVARPDPRAAELKREPLREFLKLHGILDPKVPLKDGFIDLEKVTTLTPAGLKVMTDTGIGVIQWESLSPVLIDATGWTPAIREVYLTAIREVTAEARRDASEAMAIARAKAGPQVQPSSPVVGPSSDLIAAPSPDLPTNARQLIREQARKDWPDSYTMQEFAIKNETEHYQTMARYLRSGLPGIPDSVSRRILANAIKDWPTSYRMMVFVAEREAKSWKSLNP